MKMLPKFIHILDSYPFFGSKELCQVSRGSATYKDHLMDYTNATIEKLFERFRSTLGNDLDKYRNHVYRVFLNCLLMDRNNDNEEKYAIAAVFHDIGIWTDHTIDYLDPSIAQVLRYLKEIDKEIWSEEIAAMIRWHHKVSSYNGQNKLTVATFRKADWIDVSLGLLSFGADKKEIRKNRVAIPNKGFHLFLLKKVGRNFLRHPLNPLPMFKR